MENFDDAVFQIIEKIEEKTKYDDARAVTLALSIVAARRARTAGSTKDEFGELAGTAWGLSTQ